MLDASMSCLRPFAPAVLAAVGFVGGPGTEWLLHAGGKVSRPAELERNLLYVIIAEATNMGLSAVAELCGVSYDVLAWTCEWYFRPKTLEAGERRTAAR
ncbi:Tn3 family transposase [Polymorphospora sp. A560]